MSSEKPKPYRIDLINGAMGAQRLTNDVVAERAGVAPKTVSAVRNGDPNVGLPTLTSIAEVLGLTMEQLFQERAA